MTEIQKFILQHPLSKMHTEIWDNVQKKQTIVFNPGFYEKLPTNIPLQERIYILLNKVNLDTCAKASQLKSRYGAVLMIHESQLKPFHFLSQQASKKNVCGVFTPQADHVFRENMGRLHPIDVLYEVFSDEIRYQLPHCLEQSKN